MKCPVIEKILLACVAVACVVLCGASYGDDWPTYLHDNTRSGVTQEQLDVPLYEHWMFESRHAPRPAWPGPAKVDWWHRLRELRPVVTYDRAFHAVSSGDAVYFGSTADDKVYCLDAATGEVRWSFFAEAPVRLAPTIADGKVYFVADDGWVYCLDAEDGALCWKYRPSNDRRIPGNGRIISDVPARTGVLVDNGVAHFFTGLFPSQAVYQCGLDAATGEVLWCEETRKLSPQGYLLASPTRLFVPTGRTNPAMFDRETNEYLGALEGPGGAYAIVVDDALASGPGLKTGNELSLSDPATKESVATFPGIRMVVNGDMAYLQSKDELSALNRARYVALFQERNGRYNRRKELEDLLNKTKDEAELKKSNEEFAEVEGSIAKLNEDMDACFLWTKRLDDPYALILAGDTLFAGGQDKVLAISAADGAEVWKGEVPGRAYGLSVANGRLLVSTDTGTVHCFTRQEVDREHVVKTVDDPAPYPDDKLAPVYAEAADSIVELTGITKGYCIVLGCGEGRLAYELAKRTGLNIIGVEKSVKKVAAARDALDRAGLYGVRVAVHHWDEDRLPYTTYMANLVVSDEVIASGKLSVSSAETLRLLRPWGGTACIGRPSGRPKLNADTLRRWLREGGVTEATVTEERGAWAVIRRGALEDVGEWTQLYANANHTACSMDPIRGPMAIQWFGEPGPREIIDRHHRPMSSLFKDGRLFVPGDDLVYAVDPYNGAPLWELDAPNARRIGALKDCGYMLVADEYLYLAVDNECWAVNVADGARAFTLEAPQLEEDRHDWGYINCVDDLLFGTGAKAGASFDQFSFTTCNILEGDFRQVMISEYLFCVDRHTGKKRWTYHKGAIMNSAIAIDDGRIYFAESRNDKVMNDDDGRARIDHFCESDAHLVALNIKNGRKAWERPVALPFEHIMFLNGADNVLLATGTYNKGQEVYYEMFAFDMETGEELWRTPYRALDIRGNEFTGPGGSHGEQWQHPVIIGDTIYSRPFAFGLHTGDKKDYIAYRGGHGCGGLTASAYYLYGRGDNPRMYPTDTSRTHGIQLTQVSRPGCWLNIIPAGGLVMIPESSSGCTCAYPLQTSFALIPKAVAGIPDE